MEKQKDQKTSRSRCIVSVCFVLIVIEAVVLGLLWSLNYGGFSLPGMPIAGVNASLAEVASACNNADGGNGSAPQDNEHPLELEVEAPPCICLLRLLPSYDPHGTLSKKDMANCTCPSNVAANASSSPSSPVIGSTMPPSCPPAAPTQRPIEEQWYAKGRSWHMPPRFPRCTMDTCFNYSRCDSGQELLIYAYNLPAQPSQYFANIDKSRYYTDDPDMACLFFVFVDTPGLYRSEIHPRDLPYWHGGLNHVLITFGDKWLNKAPYPESIGYASAMATVMHETLYRPGFDVSIPLPPKRHFPDLRRLGPFERKYLMTFRGLRYLFNDGTLRSSADFRGMHNGADIIVVTSCRHSSHTGIRKENATLDEECRRDEALYDSYKFEDLMNSTFGLAPAGRQPASYRFAEILSAGGVPILIVDNYVRPFETLVQWHRCALQFPSTEIHRIISVIRSMKPEEVERRQRYCIQVYERWFSNEEALLKASIAAQKTRFMGAFPSWEPPLID
ncbi:hypothetical protein KP509_07G053300 [Ceratopteris richardii]|uniref:Exostosin GT47 domain-containing protein n=1 Tax=Ceratopteris richardii TaxID=49495 RepID=A0A8T2UHU8_CERRI|nr:hypothetical protein KP509_07G053300 [Ceratopteris richardii]